MKMLSWTTAGFSIGAKLLLEALLLVACGLPVSTQEPAGFALPGAVRFAFRQSYLAEV